MNMNDPVQNLWLGKMQMELGVQISNALLAEARIEATNHQLAKTMGELEALKIQVENMGLANHRLRQETEVLRAASKPEKSR